MKRFLFLTMIGIFSFSLFSQTIIKVSPVPDEGDYTDLQTAIDQASGGNIIHVYPGIYAGAIHINKTLVIKGAGYSVPHNNSTNTIIAETYLSGNIYIDSGVANCIFQGLYLNDLQINDAFNITVERSRINRIKITGGNGIIIRQNYISGSSVHYFNSICPSCYTYTKVLVVNSISTFIENNIFASSIANYFDVGSPYSNDNSNGTLLKNNIFNNHTRTAGSFSKNNIYIDAICYNTQTNNIHTSASPTNVFVGVPSSNGYSFDARWQLTPTSVARGAADDGGDCGVFGGADPYRLSGIPDHPFIYELNVPNAGTNGGGIDINIKVRSEN